MKKFVFLLFLAAFGLFGLYFSYSKRSSCFSPDFALTEDSFHIGKISPSEEVKKILDKILDQPFHFLGSGNQSFAFESEDGSIVLKLFKFHCLYGFDPYDLLPAVGKLKELKEERLKDRKKKIDRLMQGLHIADTYNKTSSGIIYIHYPPTNVSNTKLKLQDRAFRTHFLDLDKYIFVLQYKAVTLSETLKTKLKANDVQGALVSIESLYAMIKEDLENGVYDQDHNIMANTGFVQKRPMRIDFGKLSLKKDIPYTLELQKINQERMIPWLKRNFPEKEEEMRKALEMILKNL